jgi:hypothetical protein
LLDVNLLNVEVLEGGAYQEQGKLLLHHLIALRNEEI